MHLMSFVYQLIPSKCNVFYVVEQILWKVFPQTVAATLSLPTLGRRRPWLKTEGETFIWEGKRRRRRSSDPPLPFLLLPMMKTRKEREGRDSCYRVIHMN